MWTVKNPKKAIRSCGCRMEWDGTMILDFPCNLHAEAANLRGAVALVLATLRKRARWGADELGALADLRPHLQQVWNDSRRPCAPLKGI